MVSEPGVSIDRDQAQDLDGLLAGAHGATHTFDRIAGAHAHAAREAVREAFVSSLGTSLKISAALIAAGLVLSMALMRWTPRMTRARWRP